MDDDLDAVRCWINCERDFAFLLINHIFFLLHFISIDISCNFVCSVRSKTWKISLAPLIIDHLQCPWTFTSNFCRSFSPMLMTTSDKNCFICAVDDELPLLLLHFYQSARSTTNPKVHAGWCKTADIWNKYTRERAPATMHIGWARQPWLSIASRSLSACNMSRVVERVARSSPWVVSQRVVHSPSSVCASFQLEKKFCVAFWRRSKAHYLPRNVAVGCVFFRTQFFLLWKLKS